MRPLTFILAPLFVAATPIVFVAPFLGPEQPNPVIQRGEVHYSQASRIQWDMHRWANGRYYGVWDSWYSGLRITTTTVAQNRAQALWQIADMQQIIRSQFGGGRSTLMNEGVISDTDAE